MTYLVGSRHENYGETGMAHLLEHLLFKGTPTLPGKNIPTEFARRGMSSNATTAQDRTNYFETFTASDDNLDWALRMEADRMVNSFVSRADLDSEMTVVRNEMEMGENSPARMLVQQMMAASYRWHNYGKAPIARAAMWSRSASTICARSTAATTSPTTRCSWWPASSSRRGRWRASNAISGPSRARRACCRPSTLSSPRRKRPRAGRHAARRQRAGRSAVPRQCRRAPGHHGPGDADHHPRRHAGRALYKALVERKQATSVARRSAR